MAYTGNWTANDIDLISKYITDAMDMVIEQEAKTNGMTADPKMVEAGRTAETIYLATPTVTGAGNYSRSNGWTKGKATLDWKSYTLRYDRGTAFLIDALDEAQSGGLANIGTVGNEFLRTQLIPEIDAVRLATVASVAKAEDYDEEETYTKANILSGIESAVNDIFERTGVDEGLTIYVNSNLRAILNSSTEYTKVRQILDGGAGLTTRIETLNGNRIVFVPSSRMYETITLNDGNTSGQTNGGFAGSGRAINFAVVKPMSAQGIVSYQNTAILPKGSHTEGDGDFVGYRIFHDCICPEQQKKGLFASFAPAPSP